VTGIGSEWSRQFPGYLAGAVDAAARGVRDAMAAVNQKAAAL
jgi:monoamine oxidase